MSQLEQSIEALQPMHSPLHAAATADSGEADGDAAIAEAARAAFQSYRKLVTRTVEVFGDEIKAARWLSMPSSDFAGKPPIQIAQEVDYNPAELERRFEPIFVRIEEGIYW